ncbi:MAG: phage tail tape measure protein [Methylicorpusculum sp.]|uniref:phage tail tape measure protein n=1 Tax=Methylicorpusculum sp. TaxID=2713644 RepID=UPI0027256FBD|nr:phage tail tape measure protein [Methylicorpusculum sp.]MDO8941487.1 phage tail tape measure protein [Methylicorpusculum sp.]MDP2202267.1 phage tail tape measure protein [Methylicorpusculum sp.]
MSKAAEAELRLKFKDVGATSGIDKAAKRVEQITKQTEQVVNQSNSRQRSSFERLSLARETLGVRSENKIRREIQQTEAAYKRLATSGKLSQDELTRAAEKTRQKITRLTNEMGKLTKEQQAAANAAKQFETAQSRIRTGVAVGAGVLAGGYALKAPVANALSFDERLAGMANTAFPERGASGRLAGANELEAVINRAVDLKQGGGGTRDQAAEALDALIAKGTVPMNQALSFLPTVMRTAYGSGANPLDIANLVSGLVGQGITSNQGELKRALNMITASGQAGGFEIKDMARALPGQLAVGKTAGLVGLPGLQKILTMNQAAVLTAGDTSTAGNNVLNLLTKLASSDTAKDFDKAGQGDLNKFLIDQRIKGVDAIDAWMNLIDKMAEKNPQLQAALKKLDKASNKTDQAAAIESITQLSEGGVIGSFFQDMQARGALFGLRNKAVTDRVGTFISRNNSEVGANDVNFETMAGTGAAAMRNAEQELQIRQKEAMERLIPTITRAADMFVDLSQRYPDLSAAVVGATPPVIALGTAAGISAIALGGGTGGLAGAAAMTASKLVSAAGVISAAVAGYGLGTSVVKPAVDRAVQYFTGNDNATLGTAVYDWWNSPENKRPDPSAKFEGELLIEVTPGFEVRRKAAKIGDSAIGVTTKRNDTGNIHTGAPGSP